MNTSRELNYRLYIQRENNFHRTDIKSEFSRYDDIKNGDIEKVKANFARIKKNYLKGKAILSEDPVRNYIYHMVVTAGIIARLCIDAGMNHDESYTLSDIYIQSADKAKTTEEVIELNERMQIDFATRMHEIRTMGKVSIHVRHAIDYIYDHLNEPLTLERLAKIEKLNVSYFSKLFEQEMNISVKKYILKAKLSTAKKMLENQDHNILDISYSLGFSSQSAFTAAFRKEYGVTPGKYQRYYNYEAFSFVSHQGRS